jgi:hypothetical protein
VVRPVPLTAAALAAALLLGGCGDDGPEAAPPGEPAEVQLSATATRSSLFDSRRTFRIELRNEGDAEVTIDTIQLRSPLFEAEPASDRDTQLAAGSQLLLPVPYGPSVCPGGDEAPVVVAVVGGEEVEVPLDQHPATVMEDLHAVECGEEAVRAAVALDFGTEWTPTGPRSAAGVVAVVPRGDVEVTVEAMRGNIVFGVRLADGVLPASGGFPVEAVVDRCDTHALIESKRTFKFPLDVSLDGGEPITYVLEATGPAREVFAGLIEACIGEG